MDPLDGYLVTGKTVYVAPKSAPGIGEYCEYCGQVIEGPPYGAQATLLDITYPGDLWKKYEHHRWDYYHEGCPMPSKTPIIKVYMP